MVSTLGLRLDDLLFYYEKNLNLSSKIYTCPLQ